ncbi:MAG: hypothetical protein JKX87_07565 [Cycloclasticus sp.]|nr:hypothetical protein [Cycloclasticus sp.]
MGLRSFVALPVEKGGKVVRLQLLNNRDTNTDTFVTNLAWGISHKQTVLMGLPYRLSPGGSEQIGDISLLYRHITWQNDKFDGSDRFALLGGAILATDDKRDAAWQAGGVYTKYLGRYDVSWQYRLSPANYPDWGSPDAEKDSVIELNGRWHEDNGMTHQVTLGLQRITQQWVLEAGFVKNVSKQHHTQVLVSVRFHY